MLTITTKAIEKIKEISEEEGIGHFIIRVKVSGGGCSGFSHNMYYDDIISDMDETQEADGITIVIDPLSTQYMEGMDLDYVDGLMSSGFKFSGGSIKSSCGCGKSVEY